MTIFRYKKWGPAPAPAASLRDIPKRKKVCVLACLAALWASGAVAQEIPVPSGVPMTLFDVRLEESPAIARFRFVSEAIDPAGVGKTFADMVDDLQYLCDNVAVPSLAANDWTGGEVILSISSEQTPFGETAPDVTQFFQPYVIADDACIWGEF